MSTMPVPFSVIQETVTHFHDAVSDGYPLESGGSSRSAFSEAADRMGLNIQKSGNGTRQVREYLNIATALGVQVRGGQAVDDGFASRTLLRYRTYDEEYRDAESRLKRPGKAASGGARAGILPRSQPARGARNHVTSSDAPRATPDSRPRTDGIFSPSRAADSKAAVKEARARVAPTVVEDVVHHPDDYIDKIVPILRKGPLSIGGIAHQLKIPTGVAQEALDRAAAQGANIRNRGDAWHLDAAPPVGSQVAHPFELRTDADGYITIGACADQHLCSKYERLDCLNDYYDQLEKRGITTVLNGGNWIDGESTFNKHDLLVHGMDQQLQYMAKNYPQRAGMETWAITGEDHEGWWARREGVDVGRYAENVMRNAGRTDWHDVGFMETFIPIVHAGSGKSSQLCLMHPGGGSAYALSYAVQKIIEGFDGGAKPAALLVGHYHKSSYQMTRSVHATQLGCFQDQSLFMRQKKLAAHVGGWILRMHIDPYTGAIDEHTGTFFNYFVRDFYKGRWSEHGSVNHVPRSREPGPT